MAQNKPLKHFIQLLVLILTTGPIYAAPILTHKSFDGYPIEYTIDRPGGNPKGTIVLIHGSGPSDMNEDLSDASEPGVKNLFFVDLSSALVSKGFAVLRYNKRSFQVQREASKNPAYAKSRKLKKFIAKPYTYFINDAASFAKLAAKIFPDKPVYILGHSQGTRIALQVADSHPSLIKGLAFIGFYTQSFDTILFEQSVYRPLPLFDSLDINKDSALSTSELASSTSSVAKSLAAQLESLDLNDNGLMDRSEFTAGNLSNIVLDMNSQTEIRKELALQKRSAQIIRDAKYDICFFQGELDNQAPSYNAKAIQLLNNLVWKKPNLYFRYFPGLGHALDPRKDYNDIVYQKADQVALNTLATDLSARWGK